MESKKTSSTDSVKIILTYGVFIAALFYFDVWKLIGDWDADAAAMYICAAAMLGCIVWSSIKDATFKKRTLVILALANIGFLVWLLLIVRGHEMVPIAIAIPAMAAIYWAFYSLDKKLRAKKMESEK